MKTHVQWCCNYC